LETNHDPVEIDPHDRDILTQIGRLRVDAVANERIPLPGVSDGGISLDSHEEHARHWVILDSRHNPIAAARLCVHPTVAGLPQQHFFVGLPFDPPGPVAALTRLVIIPGYRGRGFSRALDNIRIQAAIDGGCSTIVGVTRLRRRTDSLVRVGFKIVGPVTYEAAPEWAPWGPHYIVTLTVSNSTKV
jgi:GNAT superfamily N-acetyltransferase